MDLFTVVITYRPFTNRVMDGVSLDDHLPTINIIRSLVYHTRLFTEDDWNGQDRIYKRDIEDLVPSQRTLRVILLRRRTQLQGCHSLWFDHFRVPERSGSVTLT